MIELWHFNTISWDKVPPQVGLHFQFVVRASALRGLLLNLPGDGGFVTRCRSNHWCFLPSKRLKWPAFLNRCLILGNFRSARTSRVLACCKSLLSKLVTFSSKFKIGNTFLVPYVFFRAWTLVMDLPTCLLEMVNWAQPGWVWPYLRAAFFSRSKSRPPCTSQQLPALSRIQYLYMSSLSATSCIHLIIYIYKSTCPPYLCHTFAPSKNFLRSFGFNI